MCLACLDLSDRFTNSNGWSASRDSGGGPLSIPAYDDPQVTISPEGDDARWYFDGRQFDGPTLSVPATGDARIDGMLSGVKWNLVTATFSFPDEATDYEASYPGNAPNEGFAQISAQQQALLRLAMDSTNYISVEGFTLLNFVDNGVSNDATIRSAMSTDAGGSAYAYYPSTSFTGGDMWFGPTSSYNYATSTRGNHGWRSTLHELGHALGLKHAHETGGPANVAVPAAFNHHEYTVMSYLSYQGSTTGYTNETWGTPQPFMMLDIAALQYMYGADFTLNGTNSVYTFSPTTDEMFINGVGQGAPGGNRIFQTVWDGNGVDTFDLSNYTTNLQVDLRPGEASLFSTLERAQLGPPSSPAATSTTPCSTTATPVR